MRSIIKGIGFVTIALLLGSCGRSQDIGATTVPNAVFAPFEVGDPSQIVTYPDGLRLYTVEQGVGDYATNGTTVYLHYGGLLEDGTVFDESYSRGEPFSFIIGSKKVIPGIEEAVKKMRLGSKAIAFVPPSLGYGDGKAPNDLPPKIPANARLTFHIDLIGTF